VTEKSKIEPVESKTETTEPAQKSRRTFVKTAAQVAVTAPAVGLLLSATTKPAAALTAYSATTFHVLDDFTSGNTHEDIDFGPSQDDIT
jgi:hypothetical protein